MPRVFRDSQHGGHGHEGDRDGDSTYSRLFVDKLLINYRLFSDLL